MLKHDLILPIFLCKVYPDWLTTRKRGRYYYIRVFATAKVMRETIRDEGYTGGGRTHAASFLTADSYGRSRCLGALNFYKRQFRTVTVAHEAAHAALDFAARNDWKIWDNGPDEEKFALALGEIVRQTFYEWNEPNICA